MKQGRKTLLHFSHNGQILVGHLQESHENRVRVGKSDDGPYHVHSPDCFRYKKNPPFPQHKYHRHNEQLAVEAILTCISALKSESLFFKFTKELEFT